MSIVWPFIGRHADAVVVAAAAALAAAALAAAASFLCVRVGACVLFFFLGIHTHSLTPEDCARVLAAAAAAAAAASASASAGWLVSVAARRG